MHSSATSVLPADGDEVLAVLRTCWRTALRSCPTAAGPAPSVASSLGGTAPVSSRWTFALFTGADSEANLRLYARCGYREVRREALPTGPGLIHLHKPR